MSAASSFASKNPSSIFEQTNMNVLVQLALNSPWIDTSFWVRS